MADTPLPRAEDLPVRGKQGFASMDSELQHELAAKGGRSPKAGRPFRNKEAAIRAGRKGGLAKAEARRKKRAEGLE